LPALIVDVTALRVCDTSLSVFSRSKRLACALSRFENRLPCAPIS